MSEISDNSPSPAVDRALSRLDDLQGKSPADQVEVYDDIHRQLQEALSEADAGTAANSGDRAAAGISAVASARTLGAPGPLTDRR